MQRKLVTGAVAVVLACACVLPALAERRQTAGKAPARTDEISTTTTLDANQMDMFVTNVGVFAYDKSNVRGKADGLYFPNNYPLSDKTVIYDAGLWFGGVRGGDTLVTVAEYSQEYTPGPLGSDPAAASNRVYKIYKDHLAKVAAGYLVRNHDDMIPLAANDYNEWPVSQGAPQGADGTPWINELGADQMTFTVFNDGVASAHNNDAGSSDPIGLEVKQTTFAFNRSDALGNVIFMKYEITYNPVAAGQPALPLEDAYLSLWSDPDLGGSGDDYVGCNPDIGLGYCYNATNQDKAYGSQPPAVGFDFFKGPRNSYNLEWPVGSGQRPAFLPMTSFNKYINGTDPHSMQQSYAYMQGLNSDGTPLDNGTTFQMAGDPVSGTGEIDTDPADRRFMMSAGPFRMMPGETVEVVAAVLVAQGTNRLGSITFLRFVDTFAQSAFEANFVVPQPPATPVVTAEVLDRRVILTWDGSAETHPGDYPLQGYNIYQGETPAGPWTRIATYDLVDGVATIFMESFDSETGEIFSRPAQFGGDTGLRRYIDITADAYTWAGNPELVNFHPYYFGVSAYSYNSAATPNNLESSPSVVIITPEGSTRGTNYAAIGTEIVHTEGIGTGSVTVNVANPEQVTGNSYLVTFTDTTWVTQEWEYIYDDDGNVTDSTLVDVDHIALNYYTLTNTTTNTVLIPRGENVLADPNVSYPVTEGLEVIVQNHPDIIEASAAWTPVDAADEMWLYGVDSGGAILGGGVMFGANFFGSTLAITDMKTVEVRLTSNQADWSAAATYTRPGYPFAGIGQFPGSVWDTTVDPPRRLNVCFVENVADGVDGLWNPADAALGGRHYLFIMNSDYNGGVDYNDDNSGPGADVLWAWWPRLLDDSTPFADQLAAAPGSFTFAAAQPFVGGVDEFTISTTAANRSAVTYSLDKIRAVPNPYYGHSAYETKSDVKVVKFINLPDVATIKLFNIAGDHVRTLHKTANTTHEVSWDLKNEYGVYVASGVYVYYVEAPGYGDSFGKLAVMLEEERLKEY